MTESLFYCVQIGAAWFAVSQHGLLGTMATKMTTFGRLA
jgi:hypothetical protein